MSHPQVPATFEMIPWDGDAKDEPSRYFWNDKIKNQLLLSNVMIVFWRSKSTVFGFRQSKIQVQEVQGGLFRGFAVLFVLNPWPVGY